MNSLHLYMKQLEDEQFKFRADAHKLNEILLALLMVAYVQTKKYVPTNILTYFQGCL